MFGDGTGVADGGVADEEKESLVGEEEHLVLFVQEGVDVAGRPDLLGIRFFFNLLLELQTNYSALLRLLFLHCKTYHIT